MKAGVVIGGRFPAAYRTLEGLHAAGLEGRIVTSHPRSRLPAYAFDSRALSCHGWLEYFYRGVEQLPFVRDIVPAQWLKSVALDLLACRELCDCDVVNGWSGTCEGLFRRAKRRGALTLLQTGSAHAAMQKKLVDDERRRHEVVRAPTPTAMLRRQLAEYALADAIVVPSQFVRRTFVEAGVPADRLHLVPEGVDCTALQPGAKRDAAFRVLYIGHLSFRKGVAHLLEAARGLTGSGVEFVLRGALEPDFSPVLAKYAGLARRVDRVPAGGFADFISQASVVVIPSIEDGWCAVTVEAMACGVPVIVSANTGTADVVREGVDGFVVPAGAPAAIAERIVWLRNHPVESGLMRVAARQRVAEFSWDAYRSRMVALFTNLEDSATRATHPTSR